MPLIYVPKGKAREYSPLALNIYSGGCDHGCRYCYCPGIFRGRWSLTPVVRDLKSLAREAAGAREQILLSFIGDPYCAAETKHRCTRAALNVLAEARCSIAILTKGGRRCLDDIELFRSWPDGRIKVGATLTFMDKNKSLFHEPGAALPDDRISALSVLHNSGIKTWASIEPVIDADESLAIIKKSLPFVDAYKVGKLNHSKSDIDWNKFCVDAVTMIRSAGKKLYVKDDLREFVPDGFLTESEADHDSLNLPMRPENELFEG